MFVLRHVRSPHDLPGLTADHDVLLIGGGALVRMEDVSTAVFGHKAGRTDRMSTLAERGQGQPVDSWQEFEEAPMKALLTSVSIALLAGTTTLHADAKFVKLRVVNKASYNIQVDVVDKVSKKTEQNRQEVTPNGVVETKAMLNEKGGVDFTFSVVMRDPTRSYYRCMDVMTSAEGKSQLSYDFSAESGRKC